jgi:hypothetical protein
MAIVINSINYTRTAEREYDRHLFIKINGICICSGNKPMILTYTQLILVTTTLLCLSILQELLLITF